ncbi:MAG TPA: phosphate ABC transporter permease, partial [Pantoea sp.]|nr:phosphate ABC transporter permease [Pantoea sp.]
MSLKHIPVNFSDRRRRAIDRFTRRMVTSCGIAILLLMLLLFFWLIWVVLPLFAAPGLHTQATQQLWDSQPALMIGNQGDRGWRIGRGGAARFIPLNG